MIVPSNLDRDDGMDIARLVFDRLLSPLWLPRCPGGICPITPRGPIDKMPRLKNYVNKVIKLKNENVEMRPYTAVHFSKILKSEFSLINCIIRDQKIKIKTRSRFGTPHYARLPRH